MNLRSLGHVGLLMKTSPDAGTALRSLVKHLYLHSQGAVMTLKVEDELAVLTYDAIETAAEATDQIGDGAVAMMLNVMRTLCGRDFRPAEASFAHRRPADIKPFCKIFRIPLYFDAAHFSLVFSRDWLNVRPPGADKELQQLVRKQIDAHDAKHSLEFPEQVRRVLYSALMTGHASEDQIAALFSMPSRSFSRRLEHFDTGFHKLIDETRYDIARKLLNNTSLSVSQIGSTLGYSRASSFIRSFRRWSGRTPGQWRVTPTDGVQVAVDFRTHSSSSHVTPNKLVDVHQPTGSGNR